MWHKRPLNMARGYGNPPNPTNTAYVALHNNSPGSHLLAIHDFVFIAPGETDAETDIGAVHGLKGTLVTSGFEPFVTGQPMPFGEIYYGDVSSNVPTYEIRSHDATPLWWTHDWPFAILQPGWSMVWYADSSAQSIAVSITWEQITAEELAIVNFPLTSLP